MITEKRNDGDRDALQTLKRQRKLMKYQYDLYDKELYYAQKKKDGSAYEIQETKTEIKLLQKKIGLQEKEQALLKEKAASATEYVILNLKDEVKDLRGTKFFKTFFTPKFLLIKFVSCLLSARVRVLKAELSDESDDSDESEGSVAGIALFSSESDDPFGNKIGT